MDSDCSYDHLNIQFAREYILYSNVKITLEGVGEATVVYAHPPSLQVVRSGGDVVVTGGSAENELLEVEMLVNSANSSWRSYGIITPARAKVAQAMNQFNIKLDAAPMVMMAHTHFHPIITARAPVTYSGGGRGGGVSHGGGGSSHGGGGGHGGGGAGRR